MPFKHDFDCECKKCREVYEDGLGTLFPNVESDEDLEEALEHELSRMLDR